MEGLPAWEINSMPGPPPRQHGHETRYTPFTHSFILTGRKWEGWLWRPNNIRGPCGPKASWHLSYRWGNTSPRKLVANRDRTPVRCLTGAHATAFSTAVNLSIYIHLNFNMYWNLFTDKSMGGSPGDVGEATSEENQQSFIRQPFRRFSYVTAHPPILPAMLLLRQRHFTYFNYVTALTPILPASLHLRHRNFTYVTWRAAHGWEAL